MHTRTRKGFTLVELVIVVLILGILAAVAVPRLFNTSSTAIDNGVRQTLNTVRDAIELYAADHAKLPGAPGVDNLGNPTSGDLAADLADYIRGPFPKCPVGDATNPQGIKYSTGNSPIAGEPTPTEGWHYNSTTGEFIINFSGPTNTDPTVTYDQY